VVNWVTPQLCDSELGEKSAGSHLGFKIKWVRFCRSVLYCPDKVYSRRQASLFCSKIRWVSLVLCSTIAAEFTPVFCSVLRQWVSMW